MWQNFKLSLEASKVSQGKARAGSKHKHCPEGQVEERLTSWAQTEERNREQRGKEERL